MPKIDSPLVKTAYWSPNLDYPRGKRSFLQVVHCMQTPITQGYAVSISSGWFRNPKAVVSAQYVIGPEFAIQCAPESARAWHCGPNGNLISDGFEFCGYANYSRTQWLTTLGKAQIKVGAAVMSDHSVRHGGPKNPKRATVAQIRAYARGGTLPGKVMWCTHDDIRRAVGGTSHTDPMPNFPLDVLQNELDALAKPKEAPLIVNKDDEKKIERIVAAQVKKALREYSTGAVIGKETTGVATTVGMTTLATRILDGDGAPERNQGTIALLKELADVKTALHRIETEVTR